MLASCESEDLQTGNDAEAVAFPMEGGRMHFPAAGHPFQSYERITASWAKYHKPFVPMHHFRPEVDEAKTMALMRELIPIYVERGGEVFLAQVEAIMPEPWTAGKRAAALDLLGTLHDGAISPSNLDEVIDGFIARHYTEDPARRRDVAEVFGWAEIARALGHSEAPYFDPGGELEMRGNGCFWIVVGTTTVGATLGGAIGVNVDGAPVPPGPAGAIAGGLGGLAIGIRIVEERDCRSRRRREEDAAACNPLTSFGLRPGMSCAQATLIVTGGGDEVDRYEWDNTNATPETAVTAVPFLQVDVPNVFTEVNTDVIAQCRGAALPEYDSPGITLAEVTSDVQMAFFSYRADDRDFATRAGSTEGFYVASSRANGAVHTVTYDAVPRGAVTIEPVNGNWFEITARFNYATDVTITATIVDNCTGAAAQEQIRVDVN